MFTIIHIYLNEFTIVPKGGWRVNKISIRSSLSNLYKICLAINTRLVLEKPIYFSFKICLINSELFILRRSI